MLRIIHSFSIAVFIIISYGLFRAYNSFTTSEACKLRAILTKGSQASFVMIGQF